MAYYILPLKNGMPYADPILVRSGADPIEVLGFTTDGAFYYGVYNEYRDIYTVELDPESGSIITPLVKMETRFQGNNREPGYSPDGKYLAYITISQPTPSNINYNIGGGNVLIIRSIESREERKLIPGIQRMGYPRWAPDGKAIMVVEWCEDNTMALHQIDVESGAVQTVIPPEKGSMLFGMHYWTPDGKTLFYGRRTNNYRDLQVTSRDLESGEEKIIYESTHVLHHTLSQDGKWMSILSRPRLKGDYIMFVIPSEGGEAKELFRFPEESKIDIGFSACNAWTYDGRYIFFRLRDNNVDDPFVELCRVPATGGEIEKLGVNLPGEAITSFSLHPNGRHLSFSSKTTPLDPAVWVMENFLPLD
jgi:Tol biopolymer transport system component